MKLFFLLISLFEELFYTFVLRRWFGCIDDALWVMGMTNECTQTNTQHSHRHCYYHCWMKALPSSTLKAGPFPLSNSNKTKQFIFNFSAMLSRHERVTSTEGVICIAIISVSLMQTCLEHWRRLSCTIKDWASRKIDSFMQCDLVWRENLCGELRFHFCENKTTSLKLKYNQQSREATIGNTITLLFASK